MNDTILVTGGAGFIGSNFILCSIKDNPSRKIVNLDMLTYAGREENLSALSGNKHYVFVQGDIANKDLVTKLFNTHKPDAIVNFAAESHVDRSISNSSDFIHTNINGTYNLLESARHYWESIGNKDKKDAFRFLHVSTDEVYGSLELDDPAFTENSVYQPNSPYSASKASSDHLVRAWYHTYGLPTMITNCSNNYGSFQYPEKLIPLIITNALKGKSLPIYGDGKNIRDWLYVEDHCVAISEVLKKGKIGENYNIGSNNEKTNIEIVEAICSILDELSPASSLSLKHPDTNNNLVSYSQLITFVKDRAGHDRRYAINAQKIQKELGWKARESFDTGLKKTIKWYLENKDWIESVNNSSR